MPRDAIKAGQSSTVTIAFTETGDEEPSAAPASVHYRIDNLSSGEEVLADTAVGVPSNQVTIEVTAAQNAARLAGSVREVQRITARARYPAGAEVPVEYDYDIERVQVPITA